MKKKLLQALGLLLGVVVVLVGGLITFSHVNYTKTANKVIVDPKLTLEVIPQEGWIEEGHRLAKMKGCFDCHGSDLSGKAFIDDPAVGTYISANLTKGKGSKTAEYTDQDWVRAIRYGINKEHKYLQFMPSEEFSFLTDEDLAKLISYLKSLPPVDNEHPRSSVGPMAKILYMAGQMPLLFSGERISTEVVRPAKLEASESAEYGKYVAAACTGCHGTNYQGGPIPGVPPSWPHAADITKKGVLASMTFEQFKSTLQTGVTPQGKSLNPQFMPWPSTAAMSELELKALYNFLSQL